MDDYGTCSFCNRCNLKDYSYHNIGKFLKVIQYKDPLTQSNQKSRTTCIYFYKRKVPTTLIREVLQNSITFTDSVISRNISKQTKLEESNGENGR